MTFDKSKIKILLINPWIYDFAAYNLWSRPLGLLKVAEYLSAYDIDLFFIDCTDSYHQKRYGTGNFKNERVKKPDILKCIPIFYKRYGIGIDEFIIRLKPFMPFDIVIITSIMSYWYLGVQKAVEIIRDVAGSIPIVLGGIYATLYPEHAVNNTGVDFIYRGQLNESLDSLLLNCGLSLKKKGNPIPYYNLNLYEQYPFAPLLTAEGCPFNCSYCASRILSGNYRKYPSEDVLREIIELYTKGVKDFAFYDDALLVDANNHIKPILKGIISANLDLRLHTPNGLHARFLDEELAALMKKSGFKTIRLSLETIDKERQKKTGAKVSNEDLVKAVTYLKRNGYKKENIGVYLMYGLPNQGLDEVEEGIKFLKKLDVRINLTEFSPIRGTGAWDDLLLNKTITDNIDPLLTNNTVFSYLYSGYNLERLRDIKLTVKSYNQNI